MEMGKTTFAKKFLPDSVPDLIAKGKNGQISILNEELFEKVKKLAR